MITDTIQNLRGCFETGATRPLAWRKNQLHRLRTMIDECRDEIFAALKDDLGKPAMEARMSETGYVKAEIKHALKHLRKWMKPQRLHTPLLLRPGKAHIRPEPYGVALIVGPWNFPFQLAVAPLAAALAAGNCAVLKPSEIAPATSALLARYLPQYLDSDAVAVIEGDAEVAKALLAERFDYIFYTGSTAIGRKVMGAAAEHLTPVTLELGGKCPCIVDDSAKLDVAAHRIVWGKFMNAGQTCVAPDYVLVHESIEDELIAKMRDTVREFYGDSPAASADYARIVSTKHFDRLQALLDSPGDTVCGGEADRDSLCISPTICRNVPADSPLMQDEIFGPILPVLTFNSIDEAIRRVNARPKPLALYLFSSDKSAHAAVIAKTSSGGVCINDVILQLSTPNFPFGGVGESGMGRYHGRAGFNAFSNSKTILNRGTWLDPKLRYPPYKK